METNEKFYIGTTNIYEKEPVQNFYVECIGKDLELDLLFIEELFNKYFPKTNETPKTD